MYMYVSPQYWTILNHYSIHLNPIYKLKNFTIILSLFQFTLRDLSRHYLDYKKSLKEILLG